MQVRQELRELSKDDPRLRERLVQQNASFSRGARAVAIAVDAPRAVGSSVRIARQNTAAAVTSSAAALRQRPEVQAVRQAAVSVARTANRTSVAVASGARAVAESPVGRAAAATARSAHEVLAQRQLNDKVIAEHRAHKAAQTTQKETLS